MLLRTFFVTLSNHLRINREKGNFTWAQRRFSIWPIDGNNGSIWCWQKYTVEHSSWICVGSTIHSIHAALCDQKLRNQWINFSETGVTGKITVNGKNRSSNSKSFRNVSVYIHQDDALRPYLTVREVMTVATHLKLGFNVTKAYKKKMVRFRSSSCNLRFTS